MQEETVVRRAWAPDAEAIARVHVASFRDTYRELIPESFLNDFSVEARTRALATILERGHPLIWVACRDHEIVGFASTAHDTDAVVAELGPHVGEVEAIYISPEATGTGVGRALFGAALASLRVEGCREVIVWVHPDNARACAFYEGAGLARDGGEKTVTLGGAPIPHVRYRGPL